MESFPAVYSLLRELKSWTYPDPIPLSHLPEVLIQHQSKVENPTTEKQQQQQKLNFRVCFCLNLDSVAESDYEATVQLNK